MADQTTLRTALEDRGDGQNVPSLDSGRAPAECESGSGTARGNSEKTGALIETAAEALFLNRFPAKYGPWARFKYQHPDIAEIYRNSAHVALSAVGVIPR